MLSGKLARRGCQKSPSVMQPTEQEVRPQEQISKSASHFATAPFRGTIHILANDGVGLETTGRQFMTRNKGKLVYSTQTGDERKRQHQIPKRERSLPPTEQNLKIMRDKKGRRGKVVTVIAGFVLSESDLKDLAKILKNHCGAGGTAKSEESGQFIEIQGDHREKIAETLTSRGFKVKFAGG